MSEPFLPKRDLQSMPGIALARSDGIRSTIKNLSQVILATVVHDVT